MQVYVDPLVKDHIASIQHDLKPQHFRRVKSPLGLSYTRVDYLLHVHAGHIQARPTDGEALRELDALLAQRRLK